MIYVRDLEDNSHSMAWSTIKREEWRWPAGCLPVCTARAKL